MQNLSAPIIPVPALQWRVAACCLIALLIWDASGLDLLWAQTIATEGRFSLREAFWAKTIMHDGMVQMARVLWMACVLGIWWPFGPLHSIERARRVQLAVSVVVCVLAVNVAKHLSHTSCPWDMSWAGGAAQYVSHWQFGSRDGGNGHCFPAGHASVGFAFLAVWFALRHGPKRAARTALAISLLAGFALGFVQQLRGAHYFSHSGWSALLCWACCAAVDVCVSRIRPRLTPPDKS